MGTVINTPDFITKDLIKLYQEYADSNGLDLDTVAKNFYVMKISLYYISYDHFEAEPFIKSFLQPISDEHLSVNNFAAMMNDMAVKTTEEFKLQNPNGVIIDITPDLDILYSYPVNGTNIINDLRYSVSNLYSLYNNYKKQYLTE